MLSSLLQKISEPSAPMAVAMVLTWGCVADVIIPIAPPTTPAPGGNLLFIQFHAAGFWGVGIREGGVVWYTALLIDAVGGILGG